MDGWRGREEREESGVGQKLTTRGVRGQVLFCVPFSQGQRTVIRKRKCVNSTRQWRNSNSDAQEVIVRRLKYSASILFSHLLYIYLFISLVRCSTQVTLDTAADTQVQVFQSYDAI